MAKKRSRRDHSSLTSIPRSLTHRLPNFSPSRRATPLTPVFNDDLEPGPLYEVEDRRLFHPDGPSRPFRTVQGTPASIVVRDRPPTRRQVEAGFNRRVRSQTKAILTFEEPKRVLVCVRRQRRKEVLHALKRTKKGAGSRRRRNEASQISCR